MTGQEPVGTDNTISGGLFFGPVLQGHDIQVTFVLPVAAPLALTQLPAVTAGFTGRDSELAVLADLLDPARAASAVVVSAVAGLAGVGKTTLAVEAGHAALRRGWFKGGVLFLDLHGYDERQVEPGQALDDLLRALGVPAEHIPADLDERAGLYRSVLAEFRDPVLVIADNASSEAQVRPLLPGKGPHKVLVTSRHTLAGLRARLVDVSVLDEQASVELLDAALRVARPSDDRITTGAETARRLGTICGGLPLALQIVAALLIADPGLNAADLAEELAIESERLEQLAYDDGGATSPSVAAAFELSYRRLEESEVRVFRLLPVNPGPDLSTAAAAILADLPVKKARRVLTALARAHMIETARGDSGRWRMHDLLRLYAQQLSDAAAEVRARDEARDRLLGYYMSMAVFAIGHLRAPPGMMMAEEFTGRSEALAWLDAERANLASMFRVHDLPI
jgi:NB-ARC domain